MDVVDSILKSKDSFSLQSGDTFMIFSELLFFLARFTKLNNCKVSNKITSIITYDQLEKGRVSIDWKDDYTKFNETLEKLINYIKIVKETTRVNYIILHLGVVSKNNKSDSSHSNQLLIYIDRDNNKIFSFHIEPHGLISDYMVKKYNYHKYIEYLEKNLTKIGFFATTSKLKQDYYIQGTENIGSFFEILRFDKVSGYCTTWSYILTEKIISLLEYGYLKQEITNTSSSREFQEFILEVLINEILYGELGLKLYDINYSREDFMYLLYGKYRLLLKHPNKRSRKKIDTINDKLGRYDTSVNGYRIHNLLIFYHQSIIKFTNMVFFGLFKVIDHSIDTMPLNLRKQYTNINLESNTNKLVGLFLGKTHTKIKNVDIDTRRVTGIINKFTVDISSYYQKYQLKSNSKTIERYLDTLLNQIPKEFNKDTIVLYSYDNIIKKVKYEDGEYLVLSDDLDLEKCRVIDKLPNEGYLLYNIEHDEEIKVRNINSRYINVLPDEPYYLELYNKIETLLQQNYTYYKELKKKEIMKQFFIDISNDNKIKNFLFSSMLYLTKKGAQKRRTTLLKQQARLGKYALQYISRKPILFIATFSDERNYTYFCPEIMKIVNRWVDYECRT